MSIYIPGMEMPTSCALCPLATGCYCAVTDEGEYVGNYQKEKTRPDWCPLIEVPPHGRLVDGDKMLSRLTPVCDDDANWAMTGETGKRLMTKWVKTSDTIIPADKDGDI